MPLSCCRLGSATGRTLVIPPIMLEKKNGTRKGRRRGDNSLDNNFNACYASCSPKGYPRYINAERLCTLGGVDTMFSTDLSFSGSLSLDAQLGRDAKGRISHALLTQTFTTNLKRCSSTQRSSANYIVRYLCT